MPYIECRGLTQCPFRRDKTMKHVHSATCFIQAIRYPMLLASICCLLCGCGNDVTDVSHNNNLWGGYDPRIVYKLKTDIFLLRSSFFDGKGYEVSPEKKSMYWKGADVPDTIEQYRKTSWSPRYWYVKGIVTAGTKIRLEVLERHVGTSVAGTKGKYDLLYPYARILSGPYEGMLVNIFWISCYSNQDHTPSPYPEILIVE